jgi:hypothetical protein
MKKKVIKKSKKRVSKKDGEFEKYIEKIESPNYP